MRYKKSIFPRVQKSKVACNFGDMFRVSIRECCYQQMQGWDHEIKLLLPACRVEIME